jgi:hypothetical protein
VLPAYSAASHNSRRLEVHPPMPGIQHRDQRHHVTVLVNRNDRLAGTSSALIHANARVVVLLSRSVE